MSLFSKSHLFQILEISITLGMIYNTHYHIHNIAMVLLEHQYRLHVDRHICKLKGYISDDTLTNFFFDWSLYKLIAFYDQRSIQKSLIQLSQHSPLYILSGNWL